MSVNYKWAYFSNWILKSVFTDFDRNQTRNLLIAGEIPCNIVHHCYPYHPVLKFMTSHLGIHVVPWLSVNVTYRNNASSDGTKCTSDRIFFLIFRINALKNKTISWRKTFRRCTWLHRTRSCEKMRKLRDYKTLKSGAESTDNGGKILKKTKPQHKIWLTTNISTKDRWRSLNWIEAKLNVILSGFIDTVNVAIWSTPHTLIAFVSFNWFTKIRQTSIRWSRLYWNTMIVG